jgi:phage-related protein
MWKVIYYENEENFSEVFDFVEKLNNKNQAKVLSWLSILEEKGPLLPRPYADLLKDGIHELRVKLSGDQIRILYFFCFEDFIILTNVFTKKTQKVPEKQIKIAKQYRDNFMKKYTQTKLMEEYNENTQ